MTQVDAAAPAPASQNTMPGESLWFAKYRVLERHVGAIATILLIPLNAPLLKLFLASYFIRIWGMEVVYHRYFSHRSYRLGRCAQLVFALIGTQCGQRGPLWWAAKHRTHHRFVETEKDPHSPVAHSFWHAHAKWILAPENLPTDLTLVPDFAKFPELRWLNRYFWVPVYAAAALLFLAGEAGWLGSGIDGVSALGWGFLVPSALALHATSLVNSIGHMPRVPGGYQRFEVDDRSVNRPLLALLTMGAGWHNNHHQYSVPARAGFAWYEVDLGYYSLKLLQGLRIVKDMKGTIPEEIRKRGGLA